MNKLVLTLTAFASLVMPVIGVEPIGPVLANPTTSDQNALILRILKALETHDYRTLLIYTLDNETDYFGHKNSSSAFIQQDMMQDARFYKWCRFVPDSSTFQTSLGHDSIEYDSDALDVRGKEHKARCRLDIYYTPTTSPRLQALSLKVLPNYLQSGNPGSTVTGPASGQDDESGFKNAIAQCTEIIKTKIIPRYETKDGFTVKPLDIKYQDDPTIAKWLDEYGSIWKQLIWHPVHGEFETRAPIIRQLIREVHGERYLFAVYGCTPLVRFLLHSLKDGAHIREDTIGELGYGSNPLDMLTFSDPFDHKEYLLVTIDVRSASRIAIADLESAKPEATGGPIDFGPGGLGRTQRDLPIRAEHIAILNPKWAVVIWRHPETSYRLDISNADDSILFRAQRWHVGNELA